MQALDGTDADGELSEEEVLQSGSQTGVSDQEELLISNTLVKRPTTPLASLSRITDSHSRLPGFSDTDMDPVTSILDKIDAELLAIDNKESQSSKPTILSSSRTRSSPHGKPASGLTVFSGDTGLGSEDVSANQRATSHIEGSAQMYSDAHMTDGLTDDDNTARRHDDNPSDLDSVAAQQIDLKFKEIMRKKKEESPPPDPIKSSLQRRNSTGKLQPSTRKVRLQTPPPSAVRGDYDVPPDLPTHPGKALGTLKTRLRSRSANRPSASMLSTGAEEEAPASQDEAPSTVSRQLGSQGYGTDNDSIKTEDFETRFQKMLVTAEMENDKKSTNPRVKPTVPALGRDNPEVDLLQRLKVIAQEPEVESKPTPILSRPRSCSPVRSAKSEKKVVSIADDDSPRREIAQESALIQRDIARERRARSVSPAPQSPPPPYSRPLPRPASTNRKPVAPQTDLSSDIANMFVQTSATFSHAEDTLLAGHELKTIRQALFLTKKELRETEAELKHARELSEDAKSGLMVVEFKRGNAGKDLDRLTEDIRRKQSQLMSLDSEVKAKHQEARNMTSLGLTREDCMELKSMKEDNACLKTKIRTMDGLQLERDELVRQLEAAKEDVMREQRQSRVQRAELQEEIETLVAKLEEAQNSYGEGQVQMSRLEQAFRQMEKEKNEIIQDQALEHENLKVQHRQTSQESQHRLRQEMRELEAELTELKSGVSHLQGDNCTKEQLVDQLRAQLSDLQSVLAKERQDRHKTSSDQKRSLQQLKKDTAAAVLKLKESMFLEKQRALEALRGEMEQERREFGSRTEDRLTQALEDKSQALADATAEVSRLEEKLRRLEQDKLLEMDRKLNEAVNRERERADHERERALRHEREEAQRRVKDVNAQIDKEKQLNKELHREMTDLRKEFEEQRRLQREASKEKLVAVAKAKEQMKDQSNAEIDRVKFNLQQDHQRDIVQLEEKLRFQDDELIALRSERQESSMRERNAIQALENTERTVTTELNEECDRVASILGISPRTVMQTSFHLETVAEGRSSPTFKGRPVINTALANLRASNEELQNHIAELQQDVESLRTMVETMTKEKEEAIENCRLQMEKQKTQDLEKLKDKLLKDHVQEMSQVIRQCAESNQKLAENNSKLADDNDQLMTNNAHLRHYGDAALVEALKGKEAELRALQRKMADWKTEATTKFDTQLQLQMAKEREKYQSLQHHSTREQKRISDLQKREISRLEDELRQTAMFQSHMHTDSNRLASLTPPPLRSLSPLPPTSALSLPAPSSTPAAKVTSAASNDNKNSLKSSSQQLQARIKQLQEDNSSLRKQRLMTSGHLNVSMPDLVTPKVVRSTSPLGRSRSPIRDPEVIQRLSQRLRQGEQEALRAEERAKRSNKQMTNKMAEMAKLQQTLLTQNQELQELEKAYSDLNKHYKGSKTAASASQLHTTV